MRAETGGQAVRRSGRLVPDARPLDSVTRLGEEPLTGCPPHRPTRLWERQGILWLRLLLRKIETCVADFRRIAGMPDYNAYLEHLRRCHPDWPVPSEREFFALYVESRYGAGPTRCC